MLYNDHMAAGLTGINPYLEKTLTTANPDMTGSLLI